MLKLVLGGSGSGKTTLLYAQIKELLADPERRAAMGKNLHEMVQLDSTEKICDIVEQAAKHEKPL